MLIECCEVAHRGAIAVGLLSGMVALNEMLTGRSFTSNGVRRKPPVPAMMYDFPVEDRVASPSGARITNSLFSIVTFMLFIVLLFISTLT